MNFKHHQLVEIYSALKEGCWINLETRNELIQNTDFYGIWQPSSFKTWAQGSWYR